MLAVRGRLPHDELRGLRREPLRLVLRLHRGTYGRAEPELEGLLPTTPIGSTGEFPNNELSGSSRRSAASVTGFAPMLRRRDRSTTVIATGLGVDSTIARRIRIQAHLRAAGAAPRQRSAAPFFHELPTDTVPLRLPVATTARDAGRLWSCPSHPRGFRGFAALGLVCLSALSP